MICPDCFGELDDDDMGPCPCALDGVGTGGRGLVKPKNPNTKHFAGSMRQMVARKLGRIPRTDGK